MTTKRPRPKRATAARNVKPTLTREQLLSALEKLRSADEAHAKERRRPMTPSDLRRLGELATKHRLNADEQQEFATLEARFDVDRERRDLGGAVYHTPEGDYYPAGERRVKSALARMDGELRRLAPGNDALRAALLNALTDKTETMRKATPDPKTLTPIQREWLALRVTPKGETVREGRTRYPAQRDIAAALRVGKNVVNRMETELEARPDVRAFLVVMRVPLRKPRGNPKPSGTKRKKVRRA